MLVVLLVLSAPRALLEGYASSASSSRGLIQEFSAVGSASKAQLNLSSIGGSLVVNGSRVQLLPWYSLHWSIGYWLFFLVNTTTSDFYIAFLYLNNATSDPSILYLYHYVTGSHEYLYFWGRQSVGDSALPAPSLQLPTLSLQPEAKFQNHLYASGSSLQITGSQGTFRGLPAYTLLNLYNVTTPQGSWNELWTLRVDGSDYYFGIFYMFNNNHDYVQYQYQLKLNDLSTAYMENPLILSANWDYASVPAKPPHANVTPNPSLTPEQLALLLTTAGMAAATVRRKQHADA